MTPDELKEAILRLAGLENATKYVSDEELDWYINWSRQDLFSMMLDYGQHEGFLIEQEQSVPAGGLIALSFRPAGIRQVFYKIDSSYVEIFPADIRDIRLAGGGLYAPWVARDFTKQIGYLLHHAGDLDDASWRMQITPTDTSGTVKIWYYPELTKLSIGGSDDINMGNDWVEFIIVDGAIRLLERQDRDVTALEYRRQTIEERIISLSANIDMANPQRVRDVEDYCG